jgi:predicted ATP-grasp superfamily ATP-dependent carboligase
VLGLGINGLGVVRALGRAGVPVVGIWSGRDEPGRLSRYCRPVRISPERSAATLDFLLGALGPTSDRPVLLPTTDADAAWINDEQHALDQHFRFHTVPRELFGRLASKTGIAGLLREHRVEAPASWHFDTLEQFGASVRTLPMPILVKPADTFRRILPRGAKNESFNDSSSLERYVRLFPGNLPDMLFQEVVPSGDGHIYVCTVLLDSKGQPVLRYTGKKIRQYRPDYGVTCLGVSEWNEEIATIATRFLQSIEFRGLCTIEFARHRMTGRYLLLEANPRSYNHNALCTDCGVNFAFAEYSLLIGERPANNRQRDGTYWIDLPRDLGTFYRKRRDDALSTLEWLRSVLKARSFASFAFDDPRPWLHQTSELARLTARTLLS